MRFVQMSDPHILPPERQPMLMFNTIERLRDAVEAVNRLKPVPDFVVVTGDLTSDESEASYRLFKELLADLEVPYYLAPGNHDARIPFRRIMHEEPNPEPDRLHSAFVHEGVQVVILDTLDEGRVTGAIDNAQLNWLDELLVRNIDFPTVVCMHHPPVPVGVEWMDALMLQEAHRLLDILDRHTSVRLVLCGHVHHVFRIERKHYTVCTAPAVSVQFRKFPLPPPIEGSMSLKTDDPSAFHIVDVSDGGFETTVFPIITDTKRH
ncbi:MAG: phosphodiesterase [Gemmatimonadota bacterium]|nr:phosphodiesterase [Gemmatimonadota bacterium]